MKEALLNIFFMAIGCLMIVYHKSFARIIVEQQNKFWGFHFGDRAIRTSEVISILSGVGFVIFCVLYFFKGSIPFLVEN